MTWLQLAGMLLGFITIYNIGYSHGKAKRNCDHD